jgi:Rieske Fe-S protein
VQQHPLAEKFATLGRLLLGAGRFDASEIPVIKAKWNEFGNELAAALEAKGGSAQAAPAVAVVAPAPSINAEDVRAAVAEAIAKIPATELPLKGGAKLKVLTVL